MRYVLYGALSIFLAIVVATVFAPTHRVVTDISIDAPAADVWNVLADGARYGEWNPFIVRMDGELTPGATLQNTLQPEPDRQMVFRPVVLTVLPERELRWLGHLFIPRIFDGEHYFLLEERDGATHLTHGEIFTGALLLFIDPDSFRANFEAMNVALKERVEGLR